MNTHRVTLELPAESYQHLRRLVESGEFASESEAVAGALLDVGLAASPIAGDLLFERWMREEVLAADDELEADPSSGLTPADLRSRLAEARSTKNQGR